SKSRTGRQRQCSTTYEGIIPWIKRRHEGAESDWAREQYEGYMREVPCTACGGARLKPLSLAVTINERNIAEICELSIGEAAKFLAGLELSERERLIAERVTKEVNARLGFLLDVGLDYLTLSRSAGGPGGRGGPRRRPAPGSVSCCTPASPPPPCPARRGRWPAGRRSGSGSPVRSARA